MLEGASDGPGTRHTREESGSSYRQSDRSDTGSTGLSAPTSQSGGRHQPSLTTTPNRELRVARLRVRKQKQLARILSITEGFPLLEAWKMINIASLCPSAWL